jgi:hypothetical protein
MVGACAVVAEAYGSNAVSGADGGGGGGGVWALSTFACDRRIRRSYASSPVGSSGGGGGGGGDLLNVDGGAKFKPEGGAN